MPSGPIPDFIPAPEAFYLPADNRSMCLHSKRDVDATAGFESPDEALRAALLFSYLRDLYSETALNCKKCFDKHTNKMLDLILITVGIIISYLMTSGIGIDWMTNVCGWGLCILCFLIAINVLISNTSLSACHESQKRRRCSKELLRKALFAFRIFDNRDLQAKDDTTGDQAMKRACDSYRANCQQFMGDLDALRDFSPQYSESSTHVSDYWSQAGYWDRNKWFPRCPAASWIEHIKGADLHAVGKKFSALLDEDMLTEIRKLSNDPEDRLRYHLGTAATKLGLHDRSCC